MLKLNLQEAACAWVVARVARVVQTHEADSDQKIILPEFQTGFLRR